MVRGPAAPLPRPSTPRRLHKMMVLSVPVLVAIVLLAIVVVSAIPRSGLAQGSTIVVQLLAYNDFHGNLETLTRSSDRRRIGGAAVLAAYLDDREQQAKRAGVLRSLRVLAGDNIGATPLVSAVQRDEPTLGALDLLETRYSSVGNHEFDFGINELRRQANGGCRDGRTPPNCWGGIKFRYLAANVVDSATNRPVA